MVHCISVRVPSTTCRCKGSSITKTTGSASNLAPVFVDLYDESRSECRAAFIFLQKQLHEYLYVSRSSLRRHVSWALVLLFIYHKLDRDKSHTRTR